MYRGSLWTDRRNRPRRNQHAYDQDVFVLKAILGYGFVRLVRATVLKGRECR
jgi:hypothetical protein